MDMQRAELLRGPQSTLFGKNSIAGALNLTTARPTEELEGRLSISHGFEFNQQEINGVISGPITDEVRGRIAVRTYEDDGYMTNNFTGEEQPSSDEASVRVSLDFYLVLQILQPSCAYLLPQLLPTPRRAAQPSQTLQRRLFWFRLSLLS